MLERFRNSQPYVIFMIGIVSVILWIPVFIKPAYFRIPVDNMYSPVFVWMQYSGPDVTYVSAILGLVLFLLIAFLLTDLNVRYLFLEKRNYLPALFFILTGFIAPGMQLFSPALFALVFVLLSFNRLMLTYKVPEKLYPLFDAGLLISIASMIYLPYLIFMPVIWVGAFIFRTITPRNWFGSLIGFLMPWVILYGVIFFVDGTVYALNKSLVSWTEIQKSTTEFTTGQIIFFSFLLLIFLVASYHLARNISFKNIKPQRQFYFFFWMFLIGMGVLLWLPGTKSLFFIAVAIPLSYLYSHYFTFARNNLFNNFLFSFFLLCGILIQYLPLFLN